MQTKKRYNAAYFDKEDPHPNFDNKSFQNSKLIWKLKTYLPVSLA